MAVKPALEPPASSIALLGLRCILLTLFEGHEQREVSPTIASEGRLLRPHLGRDSCYDVPYRKGVPMRLRPIVPILTLTICASAVVAAKPSSPPPSNNFDPEIAYSYASGNYMDLRLANRQGSAAVLVHRAAFGALSTFDLAPESGDGPNRISFAERDKGLFVKTWTKNPVSVSASAQQIHPGPIEGSDFSPDASKLAFSVIGTTPAIMIHDFAAPSDQPALRILTNQYYAFWVRWDPSGEAIYFSGGQPNGSGPIKLYRIDASSTDGIATPLFDLPNGLSIDVTRPPASDASRLVYDFYGSIFLAKLDGTERVKLTDGALAHFNCNNSAIIHRGVGRKRPTLITARANPQSPTTWSTDSNIHHTDWLQRSPCV